MTYVTDLIFCIIYFFILKVLCYDKKEKTQKNVKILVITKEKS